MSRQPENILALDVGDTRIGVAICHIVARLPRPLKTILNSTDVYDVISALVVEHDVKGIVVGLPRGLNGQSTDQTRKVESFVQRLENEITVPVYLTDEALTSRLAEHALQGKKHEKGDIDALAAAYILQDFLTEHIEVFA